MRIQKFFLVALAVATVTTFQPSPAASHPGNVRKADCTHQVRGTSERHAHYDRPYCNRPAPSQIETTTPSDRAPKATPSYRVYENTREHKKNQTRTVHEREMERTPSYGYVNKPRKKGEQGRYYFTRWPHRVEERRSLGLEN